MRLEPGRGHFLCGRACNGLIETVEILIALVVDSGTLDERGDDDCTEHPPDP
jgi:hypothetical protein